ncbi:MAG: ABC transporter ATP-binding protein, partial [Betaproteobacteria bacterium]|nr:ABC transporter ATP-binding protein [Betaproteobacteria bacterium]
MDDLLRVTGLSKSFAGLANDRPIEILRDVSMRLSAGQSLAIMGRSGAGKSTLLHVLAGFESPDRGEIRWEGQALVSMNETQIDRLRNRRFGFVYQFHHLLDELSALENVALPLRIRGLSREEAEAPAQILLDAVGLGKRLHHTPAELSGGERQRVAVARALVGKPDCVLADEPTGNLDTETADRVFDVMLDIAKE